MAVIDWTRAGQSSARDPKPTEPMPPIAVRAPCAEARGSSAERLGAMVESHFDLVRRSLRRFGVVDSALDDAVQQVFIVAARKLSSIETSGEKPFLMGVAVRVASDVRRTWRRRREVSESEAGEPVDPQLSPEDLLDQKRALQMLDQVLSGMPIELRAAFTMFEIEGMTSPEIALALGIPLGTAASRLRRARELFREEVARIARPNGGGHG